MSKFNELLNAGEEDIIRCLYRFRFFKERPEFRKIDYISSRLDINTAQLICSLGFNTHIINLPEVFPILGYEKCDELFEERNKFYLNDGYVKLNLENLLAIYSRIKYENEILLNMPELIRGRLAMIEHKIETTVSSVIIDRYKAEMHAIYFENIVDIDFVEERLNLKESGYRALLNEATIIAESKIIPADDIFLRNTILLEEKRKMLARGLISDELVRQRLMDGSLSYEEQDMLEDHVKRKERR